MPGNNRKTWMRQWLEQWAHWHLTANGYKGASVEAAMMSGVQFGDGQSGKPQPLPRGVVPAHGLGRLLEAMQVCHEMGGQAALDVAVVRAYYLAGQGKQGEDAAIGLVGRARRSVRRWKSRGEQRLAALT